MTVCMYRDIHTLQPYIIDFTQRGCHTLRLRLTAVFTRTDQWSVPTQGLINPAPDVVRFSKILLFLR